MIIFLDNHLWKDAYSLILVNTDYQQLSWNRRRCSYLRSAFNCPRIEFSPLHMVLKIRKIIIIIEVSKKQSQLQSMECDCYPSENRTSTFMRRCYIDSEVKNNISLSFFVILLMGPGSYFEMCKWKKL